MRFGISTACLYPMETETALKLLINNGFKDFEIFLNCETETKNPFIRLIKDILNKSQSNLYSLHPYTSAYEPHMLFSNYYRRFEDGLELYKRYCAMAAELSAKYIVIHGDRFEKHHLTREEYFERFDKLSSVGKEWGIVVAQENVNGYRSAKPDFIRAMIKALPDVSFVYDIKQEYRAGLGFLEMAKVMGEHICHIHISDHTYGLDCLPPFKGELDYSLYLDFCNSINYQGLSVIEVYRSNFSEISELVMSYNSANKLKRKDE